MIRSVRGRQKPSALKTSVLFTDREDEQKAFLDEYRLLKENPGAASVINVSAYPASARPHL